LLVVLAGFTYAIVKKDGESNERQAG
jgi:hypothetical protein